MAQSVNPCRSNSKRPPGQEVKAAIGDSVPRTRWSGVGPRVCPRLDRPSLPVVLGRTLPSVTGQHRRRSGSLATPPSRSRPQDCTRDPMTPMMRVSQALGKSERMASLPTESESLQSAESRSRSRRSSVFSHPASSKRCSRITAWSAKIQRLGAATGNADSLLRTPRAPLRSPSRQHWLSAPSANDVS